MRAVITVVGRDTVGVVARVSQVCAELNINIEDVTQSIMQDMFCMIMLVNLEKCTAPMETVRAALDKVAAAMNMDDVAVILMTEHLVKMCGDLVDDLKLNRSRPLIVEIPDRHGNGRAKDSITRYVREAIGIKI